MGGYLPWGARMLNHNLASQPWDPVQRRQSPLPSGKSTETEGLEKPKLYLQRVCVRQLAKNPVEGALHWWLPHCHTSQSKGVNTTAPLAPLSPHHILAQDLSKDTVQLCRNRPGCLGYDPNGAEEAIVSAHMRWQVELQQPLSVHALGGTTRLHRR